MFYEETPPPPGLTRYIACLWVLREQSVQPDVRTIYPDGRCELVFHRNAAPRARQLGGEWRAQPRALFVAQFDVAIQLSAAGPIDCVGIRLQPAASALFAGHALDGMRNQFASLQQWAQELPTSASDSINEHASLLDWIAPWCARFQIDDRIENAAEFLDERCGLCTLAEVSAYAQMGSRSLQTHFRDQVGINIKSYARLLRLQATLRALDTGSASVADSAAAVGFSDQAHATREMRRLTGLTPKALRTLLANYRNGDDTMAMAAAFIRG